MDLMDCTSDDEQLPKPSQDPTNEYAELDAILETIEAPRFYDFLAVEESPPPDGPEWFCHRIGCNGEHEHVNIEELERTCRLRAMAAQAERAVRAARPPTGRLQTTKRQDAARPMPRDARPAPAKPAAAVSQTVASRNSKKAQLSQKYLRGQNPGYAMSDTSPRMRNSAISRTSNSKERSGATVVQASYQGTPARVPRHTTKLITASKGSTVRKTRTHACAEQEKPATLVRNKSVVSNAVVSCIPKKMAPKSTTAASHMSQMLLRRKNPSYAMSTSNTREKSGQSCSEKQANSGVTVIQASCRGTENEVKNTAKSTAKSTANKWNISNAASLKSGVVW